MQPAVAGFVKEYTLDFPAKRRYNVTVKKLRLQKENKYEGYCDKAQGAENK